jgi:hypothetical protein
MLSDHKAERTTTHYDLTDVAFWHLIETWWKTTKKPCVRTAGVPGKIQTGYLPNTIATCASILSSFHIHLISVLGDRHSMCHCKPITNMHGSYQQKSKT